MPVFRGGPPKRRTTGKLGSVGVTGRTPTVMENKAPKIVTIKQLQRGIDSLTLDARLNGRAAQVTVDTGAVLSLVRRNMVQGRIEPSSEKILLKTVTGDTAPALGESVVDMEIGKLKFKHRVLVADIEDDFIMGMDLISQHGLAFDPAQSLLKLGSETFVLSVNRENPAHVRLFACETTTIKGNTEQLVNAAMETDLGSCVGLVEPTKDCNKNVIVARTLVKTARTVPVRIANILPQGTTIKKGEVVAICTCVTKIDTCEGSGEVPKETRGPARLELDMKHLTEEEAKAAKEFLKKNKHVFAEEGKPLGKTDIVQHRINTGGAHPIRQAPRRLPVTKQEEVTKLVSDMKKQGIIEESQSPWSSPVVLVTKKDGTIRFCVDYRKLNDVTKKDSYPLPRIDDTLTTLSGSKWFSTLDLKSGYWQVGIHPDDKEKTAFTTGCGLYQFTVMPFGLCNAPATFERLMEFVLRGLTWRTCLVYLDDVMVMGRNFEEHLKNLQEVFDRFQAANLKLNPKKCALFQKEVEFLGHVVSEKGIETSDSKIQSIREWPRPRDKHEVRSFLGICTYYRRFVEGFADIAAPLHKLTEANNTFAWNQKCEDSFRRLKAALCSSPILAYPKRQGQFILDTDASNIGIGAVLSQVQDGEEKVIEYYSKILTKPERNYCVTRKELLAIVKSVDHFHWYLSGKEFLVRTDHAALSWLLRLKNPEGQVARWMEKLQQYDFKIKHRPGKQHLNADALSRRPCGDCKHCRRVDEREGVADIRAVTIEQDENWTTENLRRSQQEDDNIGPLLKYREEQDVRPGWEAVSDKSPELKALWAQWNSLRVENGLLKRAWESADGRHVTMQLVLPRAYVQRVLEEVHGGASGAHLGMNKMLAKVRERFYWVHCREDVEKWCRMCATCGASKGPTTRSRGHMKQYNVGAPFERIAIDVAGPFPQTEDGNKYVLVAMDYFSKWPEVYAIPNQEATTVARVLVDNLVCRFGVPLELHSDQGRNFESHVFQELCRLLGIHKTRTTALHPQSDGMVERFNRTLEEYLSKVVERHQRDWDRHIPPLLLAYRASIHDTTGQTPAKIVLGRNLRLPCDLVFGTPSESVSEVNGYVDALRESMLETHALVRNRIKIVSDRMKARYDIRANHGGFNEGELVWLYNPQRKKGLSPKLTPVWEGPYKIIKKINDVVYRIQRSPRSKMKVVHLNRLCEYQGDATSWN